jgi:predicted phage terminase large subunit-like protein
LVSYARAVCRELQIAVHHEFIATRLEAIEQGKIHRLMIFCPPRHGKTTWGTQLFPAWYLGKHPDRSIITATYGQDLADDFGRKVRNLVTAPLHQAIFPDCRLADDASSMRRFGTTAGGVYYAVGREGPITGRGAHLFIIDDPLKGPEEAHSETVRRALHDWYTSVAYTRLQPGAATVIIQTRWHQDDLAGWLLREHADEGWEVISLPAIAEIDEHFRRVGEALWPEQFPVEALQQIRTAIGEQAWARLYQQQPAAAEGVIFKREWWRLYLEPPQLFKRIVQSWDTGFKAGAENDYSVCTTWGVADNGYYLLWLWRGRVEFPELKRKLKSLAEQYNPNAILIEDKASGQSLIQELRSETSLPIRAVRADSDKVTRAHAVTPLIEAGRVFLPEDAAWLADYLEELSAFPNGLHDDAVDSTTQALNYLRKPSTTGIIDYYEQESERMQREEEEWPRRPYWR